MKNITGKSTSIVISNLLFEGAKITINRPEVQCFRPETNIQMLEAMEVCRERTDIDVVVLRAGGAFCSGGDQRERYWRVCGEDGVPRLNVLDLHKESENYPSLLL